jgi:hypothetical protein
VLGFQFGFGLIVSETASPTKIPGFFNWRYLSRFDPSFALVALFGVANLLVLISYETRVWKREGKEGSNAGAIVFWVGWPSNWLCPGLGLLRIVMQPDLGLA